MKRNIIILSFLLVAFSFNSCKKDLEKVTIKQTITANTLTPLTAGTFVLQMADSSTTFQTFAWTAVDFGIPAQVTYTLQIDTSKKFTSPYNVLIVSNLLTAKITVADFNKALLNYGVAPGTPDSVKIRVKATINPNVAPIYTNVTKALMTSYAVTFPPIYMTGDATGGWNWNLYTYKELRSSAPNIYSTVGYFVNNGAFRFFKQTDWSPTSYNFPYFTGTVSNLFVNANDGDSNFKFTGTTGYYQVTVNMTTKSVAMAAVAEPMLFMTGQALGGWDWTTHFVKLTWLSNGIFRATATFTNGGASSTFRFFGQQDWGPTGYNFPFFSAGTVSNKFVNANDGDKNFQFVGTTGSFTITVNLLDFIVSM